MCQVYTCTRARRASGLSRSLSLSLSPLPTSQNVILQFCIFVCLRTAPCTTHHQRFANIPVGHTFYMSLATFSIQPEQKAPPLTPKIISYEMRFNISGRGKGSPCVVKIRSAVACSIMSRKKYMDNSVNPRNGL